MVMYLHNGSKFTLPAPDIISIKKKYGYTIVCLEPSSVAYVCEEMFGFIPNKSFLRIYPTGEKALVFVEGEMRIGRSYHEHCVSVSLNEKENFLSKKAKIS